MPHEHESLNGSFDIKNCAAKKGYYGFPGTNAVECSMNSNGLQGSVSIYNCTANAGFYWSNDGNMTICSVNTYCLPGSVNYTLCPSNSNSPPQSSQFIIAQLMVGIIVPMVEI